MGPQENVDKQEPLTKEKVDLYRRKLLIAAGKFFLKSGGVGEPPPMGIMVSVTMKMTAEILAIMMSLEESVERDNNQDK